MGYTYLVQIHTSYAMISSGVPWNIPRITCNFSVYERASHNYLIPYLRKYISQHNLWDTRLAHDGTVGCFNLTKECFCRELSPYSCPVEIWCSWNKYLPEKRKASFKNIKFPRRNYHTDSSKTSTLYCLYCSPLKFLPRVSSKIVLNYFLLS